MSARAGEFYIDGKWVKPKGTGVQKVVNPATEEVIGEIALGNAADVDMAAQAAKAAFAEYSQWEVGARVELLEKILKVYETRHEEMAQVVCAEMGAPIKLAREQQAQAWVNHLREVVRILKDYEFEVPVANGMVRREPVGVVAMVTPWNWPVSQIALKVGPALAAGCTMVLKPTEVAPFNALILAEVLHEAGVPKGVFNLVNGTGPEVGAAMSAHAAFDMASITGSTRAGKDVAERAAATVKRVTQELGGKSPNIILDDVDVAKAAAVSVNYIARNCGQNCNAPTRVLVPHKLMDDFCAAMKAQMEAIVVGDPADEATQMGPLAGKAQFERVQGYIQKGLDEGATLLCGGLGRPGGLTRGYFVKPTVFAGVRNDMVIAREEIFGPVLCVIGYDTVEEAIEIGNDTDYGLAGYVQGGDAAQALAVAKRIRAGSIGVNGSLLGPELPFGGYKMSGNGRERGVFGFEDYLEVKAIAYR
ncbi:MAG: aldehyde dehydrogenase family protein [Proteobacteria bacterium]|nr:aldehyde dehydrogenase family protein [Pseudomonadota bacterium]